MRLVTQHPERLRDERLRVGTARTVDRSPGFCDRSGLVRPDSKAADDLATIIHLLGEGSPIPERFYRNFVGDGKDQLLIDLGIKHLHLGGSTSDILLFLVEYEDKVLLLEINNHKAFSEEPVGTTLHRLHSNALSKEDASAKQAALHKQAQEILNNSPEAIAAKNAKLKAALRPKRTIARGES